MTRRLYTITALIVGLTPFTVAQSGRTIQVDIAYTGSGTVDGAHKIYVALWSSPQLDGVPADVQPLASKTGTVTFKNVQAIPAYVSAAYDPTGKWDAQSPPPPGSSLAMYGNPPNPNPIQVEPGKTTKIQLKFADANKAQ
jgi:hypothetical protein